MKYHPGQTIRIDDVAGIVGSAFPLATTPSKITTGFRVSGIVPFNRFIFDDDFDFAPSYVTDRAAQVEDNTNAVSSPSVNTDMESFFNS